MPGPLLVVMVPARNAAADLPGFLESVARFADAVVALDDGSTDDTGPILAAHPLVCTLLTNPRRDTYAGWDDRENRQRLLDAALALAPRWVMALDADERLTPDDAEALRAYLDGPADPEAAYTFPVLRMIDDLEHYDQDGVWVARCFAPMPGDAFPAARLHFAAVPTRIPRARWRRTTIRIQHLAGLTAERRRARFDKYREVDPDTRWQASYDHLLDPPDGVHAWRRRSPLLPVVANEAVVDPTPLGPGEPALSVVVAVDSDEADVEGTLDTIVGQVVDAPFEVVVVTGRGDRTAAVVRERFPTVTVVEAGAGAGAGALRNAGLAAACGRYVAFVDAPAELPPGSLAARVAAHRKGWAMVTGAVTCGGATRAGWAAYFLDHADALPGRPSGVHSGATAGCSYPRAALLELGGFPEGRPGVGDRVLATELYRQGYGGSHEAAAVTHERRPVTTGWDLVRDQYADGRARSRALTVGRPGAGSSAAPGAVRRYVVRSVPGRLRHVHQRVRDHGSDLRRAYLRARPWIVVGVVASWAGGCVELLVCRADRGGWWPWRRS